MTETEKEEYKDQRSTIAMINVNGFLSNIDLTRMTLSDSVINDIIGTSFDIAEFFIAEQNKRNKNTDNDEDD